MLSTDAEAEETETLGSWHEYIERNFASEFQGFAKEYVSTLLQVGFPVIFDLEHLARRIGYPGALVRAVSAKSTEFYRSFLIPKRTGGSRTIQAPYPALLHIQRWILRRILLRFELSPWAHGFVAQRSIVTNALEHVGAKSILRMDISDFFPSIRLPRVIAVFRRAGYLPGVSYAMACLCTLDGQLPQGAATSPAIANIVARPLDRRLAALADRSSLRYTRYADDMIFSGNRISGNLPGLVCSIVKSEGFTINDRKTMLARDAQRLIVTGVSISAGRTRLPRGKRRELRALIHRTLSYNLLKPNVVQNPPDPQYLQRLLGSLAHWINVEPTSEYALKARDAIVSIRAELRGLLPPTGGQD
jgi:RNA-directed DNA polymerase